MLPDDNAVTEFSFESNLCPPGHAGGPYKARAWSRSIWRETRASASANAGWAEKITVDKSCRHFPTIPELWARAETPVDCARTARGQVSAHPQRAPRASPSGADCARCVAERTTMSREL